MKTIPQLREEMLFAVQGFRYAGLNDLADVVDGWVSDLYRRKPVRRVTRKNYAPANYREIRHYAERHPDMTYMEIGTAFGCSTGRVSEALAGFRE